MIRHYLKPALGRLLNAKLYTGISIAGLAAQRGFLDVTWRSIVLLFSNNFSRLVLLANLVAWPLAWFAMQRWLENFAYRIDLSPLIFIGSGAIALCIAWVTVGGTAAKAANARPVLALRYE